MEGFTSSIMHMAVRGQQILVVIKFLPPKTLLWMAHDMADGMLERGLEGVGMCSNLKSQSFCNLIFYYFSGVLFIRCSNRGARILRGHEYLGV